MSSTTIKVGQTQQLFLTVDPKDGDLSTLAYTAANDAVTISQNEAGVLATGVHSTPTDAPCAVIATVQGEDADGNPATITAECDVTVSRPLVRSMSLAPSS